MNIIQLEKEIIKALEINSKVDWSTVDQYAFLSQFIKVWDKAEERDYKMMSDERNKK